MRKSVVFVCVVLLIALSSVRYSVWNVRANEYFGDGTMLVIEQDARIYGIIRAWGWYAIYGTKQGCRIIPISSPVGDAAPIACAIIQNDKGRKFSGWIDFRGHTRPFCGAMEGDFPQRCYGE